MCGWSRATFGRIESGEKVPTGIEIAIVLGALGIRGSERKHLLELAHDAHRTHWWEVGRPGLPSQLVSLLDFEQRATKITDVALGFVPGLLQTADYARATDDWRKSSHSGEEGNCVEVGRSTDQVGVRDTKDRDGGTLQFDTTTWNRFLRSLDEDH